MISIRQRYLYVAAGALVLLLACLVFYPLGNDLVVFDLGGSMIFHRGAVPYRDFIDMKQPLIYYLYGFASFVLGHHEWSIRIVDVVYHAVALTLYFRIIRRVFQDERIALTAVVAYVLYYMGSIGQSTTESFALLPQLLVVHLLVGAVDRPQDVGWRHAVVTGSSLLLLGLTKITLLFWAPALVIWCVRALPRPVAIRFFARTAVVSALLGCTYLVWLWSVDGIRPTLMVLDWLRSYAQIVPLFSVESFRSFYYHTFPSQFLTTFAPTFVLLFLMGVLWRPSSADTRTGSAAIQMFRLLCLLSVVFGLIGIAYERKAFNYHFTRIAWCVMPFVAEELVRRGSSLKAAWRSTVLHRISAIAIVAVMVLYSPIPRVVDQAFGWPLTALRQDPSAELAKLGEPDAVDLHALAARHPNELPNGETIFLWGNAARAYYEFDRVPATMCIVNPEFESPWTPQQWKDSLMRQLERTRPYFFLCQRLDARFTINGTTDDSYESLRRFEPLYRFVEGSYSAIDSSKLFILFRRRS